MYKITPLKSFRTQFRLKHPLVSSNHLFDSWMTLCEYVVSITEGQDELSDEIMDTAEEV